MSRVLPWLLALLLSLSLAVERLHAVLRAPGEAIVGNWRHPDCLGNHWLMVWVAEQLSQGQSIVHNPTYFVPFGDAPWLAGNGSEGFLYLPLHLIFGWPVGLNLYAALLIVGNGLAGYGLGRAVGAGPWAALLPAAAAGSSVYVGQEMSAGRFSQANIGFLIGAFAAWLWLLREPTRPRALLAGVLTAIAAILYWYYGFFLAICLALLLLGRGLRLERAPLRALLGAGGLSLLLALPVLWIYLSHWSLIPGVLDEPFPHTEAVGDSVRLMWPFSVGDNRQAFLAMPLPLLVLGALALLQGLAQAARRRLDGQTLGLWAVVLVFLLLSLGVNGPLYEPLYGMISPLRRFWWPHRHIVIAQMALAALAALWWSQLSARLAPRIVPLLSLLLALCMSPALRLQGDPVTVYSSPVKLPSAVHAALAELPGEVILQLPFTPEVASTQTPLIYQLMHHKRMINGHAPWVKRVRPPAWDQHIQDNSFLAGLAAYERGELGPEWRFDPQDLRALQDEGLAYVVLEREHFPLPLRRLYEGYGRLLRDLFGVPELRVDDSAVYRVEAWTGRYELTPSTWSWPPGLERGGTHDQPLSARRSPSPVFDPQATNHQRRQGAESGGRAAPDRDKSPPLTGGSPDEEVVHPRQP